MKTIYLVCGVSGSGKSWVCRQVRDKFFYVPHDKCWIHPSAEPAAGDDPKWGPPGAQDVHVELISKLGEVTQKPIITECPFAERKAKEELEAIGFKVIPVFVVEDPGVVADRYAAREGKPLPKAAHSRASSIAGRAREWNAFHGTSEQVLQHLKGLQL